MRRFGRGRVPLFTLLPLLPLLLLVGVLAAGSGCGTMKAASGASGSTSSPTGTAKGAVIHTKTVTVNGNKVTVLADSKGLTLYSFTPDSASTVACTAACAKLWPPLLSPDGAPSSTPALPGTLRVLNGANGPQVLYNGHPLYTYAKDGDAGDAYGEGIGGKWHVATPALAMQTAPAAPAASTPTSSGGYGG